MIFIDRSIPRSVANALKCVRDDVLWLEDEFPHDAKDEDWLKRAGVEGWLVISHDKRIRTRPAERQALIDYQVGAFILGHKRDINRWQYLKLLVGKLDEMEQLFKETLRPFVYTVSNDSNFRRIDQIKGVTHGE